MLTQSRYSPFHSQLLALQKRSHVIHLYTFSLIIIYFSLGLDSVCQRLKHNVFLLWNNNQTLLGRIKCWELIRSFLCCLHSPHCTPASVRLPSWPSTAGSEPCGPKGLQDLLSLAGLRPGSTSAEGMWGSANGGVGQTDPHESLLVALWPWSSYSELEFSYLYGRTWLGLHG